MKFDWNIKIVNNESDNCLLFNVAILNSVKPAGVGFSIENVLALFNLLLTTNALSEFENGFSWSNLQESFDYTINDPTILMGTYVFPEDMCQALNNKIHSGTVSILSSISFNSASLVAPVRTSPVILAPSKECFPKCWTKESNLVTGPAALKSAYRNK